MDERTEALSPVRVNLVSALLALVGGACAFVISGVVESRIMWLRRAGPGELEWISDVILSVAVVSVTYLWLHLRASRSQLASLERQRIAMDNELRLEVQRRRGSEELRNMAIAKGMRTLLEDGIRAAKAGITTIDEVLRVARA